MHYPYKILFKAPFSFYRKATIMLTLVALLQGCEKNGGNNSYDTPGITVSAENIALVLPQNCGQPVSIKNTGGTPFSCYITDDEHHSGLLSFKAGDTVRLQPGDSVVVNLTVKSNMISNAMQLGNSTLTLEVFGKTSNTTLGRPLTVNITTMASLAGNWSGNWDGVAVPKQDTCICQVTDPADSVHGTWNLHLATMNAATQKVSGSLSWKGNDAYYDYTYNAGGDITGATLHRFAADITMDFDSTNATIKPDFCAGFFIVIKPKAGNDYGPTFQAEFDPVSGRVYTTGNGFETHPYDINHAFNYSAGEVKGVRQ